jgi:hypothetical protein
MVATSGNLFQLLQQNVVDTQNSFSVSLVLEFHELNVNAYISILLQFESSELQKEIFHLPLNPQVHVDFDATFLTVEKSNNDEEVGV